MSHQPVLPARVVRDDGLADRFVQDDDGPEAQVQLAVEPVVDVGLGEVLIEGRRAFGLALAVVLGQDELAEDGRSAEDSLVVVGSGLKPVVFLGMDVVVEEVVAGFVGAGEVEVEERFFGV